MRGTHEGKGHEQAGRVDGRTKKKEIVKMKSERRGRGLREYPGYGIQDSRERGVEIGEKMMFELSRHQEGKGTKRRRNKRKE